MSKEQVTVGCKIPHGLLLQIRNKQGAVLAEAKVDGPAVPMLPDPRIKDSKLIMHKAALTKVDKDLWEAWVKDNKGFGPLVAGHIYAHDDVANTIAEAKEKESEKTGLEQIDPSKEKHVKKADFN